MCVSQSLQSRSLARGYLPFSTNGSSRRESSRCPWAAITPSPFHTQGCRRGAAGGNDSHRTPTAIRQGRRAHEFHHAGPFRNAVLDGVLTEADHSNRHSRAAEYLWEFSLDSGMTVIHVEDFARMGVDAVIAKARESWARGRCTCHSISMAWIPRSRPARHAGDRRPATREAQALCTACRAWTSSEAMSLRWRLNTTPRRTRRKSVLSFYSKY